MKVWCCFTYMFISFLLDFFHSSINPQNFYLLSYLSVSFYFQSVYLCICPSIVRIVSIFFQQFKILLWPVFIAQAWRKVIMVVFYPRSWLFSTINFFLYDFRAFFKLIIPIIVSWIAVPACSCSVWRASLWLVTEECNSIIVCLLVKLYEAFLKESFLLTSGELLSYSKNLRCRSESCESGIVIIGVWRKSNVSLGRWGAELRRYEL